MHHYSAGAVVATEEANPVRIATEEKDSEKMEAASSEAASKLMNRSESTLHNTSGSD